MVKDIDKWNILSLKINIIVKKKRPKMKKEKIQNFLSTLFGNKGFMSRKSPILADFENITYYWIKIVNVVNNSVNSFKYIMF